MEDEIGLRKALDTYDELKEEAQLYYNSLNLDTLKSYPSPSLKYALYNAKKLDVLKNDFVKRIYIKSSEEIIIGRIKYYLNYEKKFLIFNDIINQLINLFNINFHKIVLYLKAFF